MHILKIFWECIFLFVCFRLVASRGSQGLTQWCLKNRSFQWIGARRPQQRWLVAQTRWESQEESRRAGMERPAITGKVGLCPAVTFPFGHCCCWTCPPSSRLFVLCVQRPDAVQVRVCSLLALWDGEEEGRRRSCETSSSWTGCLLSGGKTTFKAPR